jgi:RNA polymerase sigma-70 factor, ECF subfamily
VVTASHYRPLRAAGPHRPRNVAAVFAPRRASTSRPAPDPVPPPVPEPAGEAGETWLLVRRAQDGHQDAFAALYDRYRDTVYRFVYFRVGNRQTAEDLTSETFARMLKRINSFTWQGRDFAAWLVTVARNLTADHFKSGRYRLEVLTATSGISGDPTLPGYFEQDPLAPHRPEDETVDYLTARRLAAAVKKLNPEQEECIVLRFYKGFSVAEVAEVVGKNEGAIKALQYRAVRALARVLAEEGWVSREG